MSQIDKVLYLNVLSLLFIYLFFIKIFMFLSDYNLTLIPILFVFKIINNYLIN